MNQEVFKKAYEDQLCEHAVFVDYEEIVNDSTIRNTKEQNYCIGMEECSELIQQLSKAQRGKMDRYHLLEELADVLICIDKICRQEGISKHQLYTAIEVKALEIEKEKK